MWPLTLCLSPGARLAIRICDSLTEAHYIITFTVLKWEY